jgi:uncharacterized protein
MRELAGLASVAAPPKRKQPLSVRTYKVMRWLHVYISMFSLLIILFFALTGITLNHPTWTFGQSERKATQTGTMPAAWQNDGTVDWLLVSEYLKAQHGVKGAPHDYRAENGEAIIGFNAPGYQADATIDMKTGAYKITATGLGFVAVMNDLHKGRDVASSWKIVIDISGWFLTLMSITGLSILLFLKKMRLTGLLTAAAGIIIAIGLMHLASR